MLKEKGQKQGLTAQCEVRSSFCWDLQKCSLPLGGLGGGVDGGNVSVRVGVRGVPVVFQP